MNNQVLLVAGHDRTDYTPGQCCVTTGPYACALPCINLAVESIKVGCRHEHIADHPICTEHPQLSNRPVGTLLGLCRRCYDHDGHECPVMLFERIPLASS